MLEKQNITFLIAVFAAMPSAFPGAVPVRTHAFKVPAKMEMLRPGEVKPQGWKTDAAPGNTSNR